MQLVEYKLKTDPTLSYVIDNLGNLTTLSSEICRLIQPNKGRFFTLLPKNRDLEKLHQFQYGGILEQKEPQPYSINGKKSYFSPIPSVDEEMCKFILKKMSENKNLVCLAEEPLVRVGEPGLDFYIKEKLFFFYKKEVYYFLENSRANLELLIRIHRDIHAIWHSLSFLTSVNWDHVKEGVLTIKDLKDACAKAELVIIGAYDAEGYVFWEKQ